MKIVRRAMAAASAAVMIFILSVPGFAEKKAVEPPEHTPITYTIKAGDDWGNYLIRNEIFFKGDTIKIIPDEEPTPESVGKNGATIWAGIYFGTGDSDITEKYFKVNERATYTQYLDGEGEYLDTPVVHTIPNVYTSLTVISDTPVIATTHSGAYSKFEQVVNPKTGGSISYRVQYNWPEVFEYEKNISYELDDGVVYDDDGEEKNPDVCYYTYENYDITLTQKPVKEGFHFDKWVSGNSTYIKETDTENTFTIDTPNAKGVGGSRWDGDGVIVFVAQYKFDRETYTLKFDANGGIINGYDTRVYEINGDTAEDFVLSDYEPVLEGKYFAGWYADEEFTQKILTAADMGYEPSNAAGCAKTVYAKWNDYQRGDISKSGAIDLYDAIEVAKYIMNMRTFTDEEMEYADYNGDGIVNLYDAVEIARFILVNK